MSKIPADIEDAACRLCEQHLGWATTEIVMKAILAERKRCADVVREIYVHEEGEYWIANRIANTIEAGK